MIFQISCPLEFYLLMVGPPTLTYQSIRLRKSKLTQQGGPYWSFEYDHIMKSFILDFDQDKNKFCFTPIEFFASWPKTNLYWKYRILMIFELEMWKWQCLKVGALFCITRYSSHWRNEINEYVVLAVKNIHYPVHSHFWVKHESR